MRDTVEFGRAQPVGAVVRYRGDFWRMETPYRAVREPQAGAPLPMHTPGGESSLPGTSAGKLNFKKYMIALTDWQQQDPNLVQFAIAMQSWEQYGHLMHGFWRDSQGQDRMTESMTYKLSEALHYTMWEQVRCEYSEAKLRQGLTLNEVEYALFPNVREQIQAAREREAQNATWDTSLSFAENKQKINAVLKWCTRLSAGARWDMVRDSLRRGNIEVYNAIFMNLKQKLYNAEATDADFQALWEDIKQVEEVRQAGAASSPPAPKAAAYRAPYAGDKPYQQKKWARKAERTATVAALPAAEPAADKPSKRQQKREKWQRKHEQTKKRPGYVDGKDPEWSDLRRSCSTAAERQAKAKEFDDLNGCWKCGRRGHRAEGCRKGE
jgi:hypothetical protein